MSNFDIDTDAPYKAENSFYIIKRQENLTETSPIQNFAQN